MSNGDLKSPVANGHAQPESHHILQPRARKATSQGTRAANDYLTANAAAGAVTARPPHERALTPVPPPDAPESTKATFAARQHNRRKTKARIFPTVEYTERVSYFDPRSSHGNFRGFFVLFWIGLAIMVITAMLRNLRETGNLLSFKQWSLFTKDVEELALSDFLMCGSTAISLPLHMLFKRSKGILAWSKSGMVVQSIYQSAWLWFWIGWPFLRSWSWTSQVFFTLHTLCMGMKMHSYAFYNGHLSNTLNRLKELDMPIGPMTPTTAAIRYPSTGFHFADVPADEDDDGSRVAESISPIVQLRDDLAKELTSPMGNVTYPQNLTAGNFADFLLCPTLCYELEYPRTASRSYWELFYKTLAVFGCIFLMVVTSEEFIIPVLDESRVRLIKSQTAVDSALIFAESVSRLLFPFMVTFLLVFLVIFEYALGAFAEITCFADRQFYSDWWNSLDWMEFSREWNKPVYSWLRRHVYSASRSAKLSKPAATGLTFLVSALAHELIMGCITRKFRGYGFILMMLQIPFVAVQQLPWVRKQALLNNIIFWCCMILGLSLLCALYVLV